MWFRGLQGFGEGEGEREVNAFLALSVVGFWMIRRSPDGATRSATAPKAVGDWIPEEFWRREEGEVLGWRVSFFLKER